MKHLSYLNKYFAKYKWHFISGIIFIAVSNVFGVLPPQVIRLAFDLVKENIGFYQLFEGFELQSRFYKVFSAGLLFFGIAVLVLALLKGWFMFLMRQTIIVMSRKIEFDLKNEMYDHYQKLSLAFYKRSNTGDLMSRITEDVSRVRMYLGPALMYSINLVVLFVMVIATMISVNPLLTLYVLTPLPILSLSIYYVNNIINKKSEVIQEQLSKLTTAAQEIYSGIRVIKAYVQESHVAKFFDNESEEYKNRSLGLARVEAFFFPLMMLLIGLSTILTIYVGGIEVMKGRITTGNIAEFVIYINMLTWPVTAIGWVASIVQRAAASQKRINQFLNTEPDIVSPSDVKIEIKGDVRFENVSFTYPDTGIQALKNVSFHLKPGEQMAIIGRTGSGKSTIADLLTRLYDVTEGRILIDGKDIRELSLPSLRQQIGYVPQDVFLFSDTISNNILFAHHPSEDEAVEVDINNVIQASRHASINTEIQELPAAYHTRVGERGVTLSGGQKQRVSIARAIIKNPKVLMLDDSLSAVDAKTEKVILGNLHDVLQEKTAIIITHRVFTLLEFDKIIFLEDGQIVEEGTHEELLKKKGHYYELYEKQQVEEQVDGP